MSVQRSVCSQINDSRLFEDDMDNIVYEEPPEEISEKPDEETQFWLDGKRFSPGIIDEFWNDCRSIVSKLSAPFKRRTTWAASSFIELGLSKYCLIYFIVFVFVAIYFGTLLHETLHIVAAAFCGEIPVGIRLNLALYAQVGDALSIATGGFIQSAIMDGGNPGSAIIRHTDSPLHTAIIGMFPNVILFMIGFTWLRKGLNEKRPGYFGAGLVFACSNLEIFVASLRTDVTPTANYIASLISITGNDVGAINILLAIMVLGLGYSLSVLYDKWQRSLTIRQERFSPYTVARSSVAITGSVLK